MITPSRPSDPRQVDWTITRCNRFLRPIVSRIASLRKIKERKESSAAANPQNAAYSSLDTAERLKRRERSSSPDAFEAKQNDPDWMAGPTKKRKTARHYSARLAPTAKPLSRSTKSGPHLLPGELSIPTPYVSRVAAANVSHSPSDKNFRAEIATQKSRSIGRPKGTEADIVSAKFVSKTEDESQLVQNLVKGFLDLMDATNQQPSSNTAAPRRGARSLFSSCLRQVPAFIADTEAYMASRAEDGEDPCDVATDVYKLLEDTFELVPGRGWTHMREVVRAHGVSLIKSTIEEGLLSREDARTVIRHLLKPQRRQSTIPSPAEAKILLSALIATESPFRPSKCCAGRNQFYAQTLNNVGSLSNQVENASRRSFELRGFRELALSTFVPIEWMASARVLPLWSNILRILFDQSNADITDAYRFLETAVFVGTGLEPTSKHAQKVLAEIPAQYAQQHEVCPRCPRPATGTFLVRPLGEQQVPSKNLAVAKTQLCTAFNNTLSSFSTILSSFTIAVKVDPIQCSHIDNPLPLWILNSLSLDILMHYKRKAENDVPGASEYAARRSSYILASTLVSQVTGCLLRPGYVGAEADEIVECINMLDTASDESSFEELGIVDSLPELICSIAQGSSKISKGSSLASIQHIVRSLCKPLTLSMELSVATRQFLRRLALSSAIEYARRHKAPEHQALVREIERSMTNFERSRTLSTPARCSTKRGAKEGKRGFRWEEGICEWVAATPYPVLKANCTAITVFSSPVASLPQAPGSDKFGELITNAYMSPVTISDGMDGEIKGQETSEGAIRLSDLLVFSSPVESARPVPKQMELLHQIARKRSRGSEIDRIHSNKRQRNVPSSQEFIGSTNEQGNSPKRTARNRTLSDQVIQVSLRRERPHVLKSTLSERYAINDSSDDELSVQPSPKQRSRKRGSLPMKHVSRRRPAGLQRSFSATTRPPKRLASAHTTTDTADDELSIL
jgi:hypothetical protein